MFITPFSQSQSTKVLSENLTSQIDSSASTFTTARAYRTGKLRVYWNGVRQFTGVTVTETSRTTFSLSFVPQPGDYLFVDYLPIG